MKCMQARDKINILYRRFEINIFLFIQNKTEVLCIRDIIKQEN